MQPSELERLISRAPLLRGVGRDLLVTLASRALRRELARGERLWRAGDAATAFTLILSGLVKIVRRAPDGTDAILGLFGPGETIGDSAVLGRSEYPADAVVASARAEVLRLEAAPVLAELGARPEVARAMTQALLDHTEALQAKIRILSAGAVPRRLAALLLFLADRFGDEVADGTTRIPLVLSRMELAALISARVETTIRTLSKWQKAGLVAADAQGITIRDLTRLRDLLGE